VKQNKNATRPTPARRVVVLGAGGFLGGAVAKRLADVGHDVTAFWRKPTTLAEHQNVRSVVGDIRDTSALADAIEGAEVVYHFASATHPSLFFTNPAAEDRETLQPLMVMMETAHRSGVKKIVFPSSGGIYADSSAPRKEDSPLDPQSPYGIFKLTAEHLLRHAARCGYFSVDVFRVGNPYGPGQPVRSGQGVLSHWIRNIQEGTPLLVFGDGKAERDYIYLEDVCALLSVSCDRLEESGTFNLGTGVATSLNSLIDHLQSFFEIKLEVLYQPGRVSDLASISLSPERLLRIAPPGFRFTDIRSGIERTLLSHRML
jgi:UDP-glucose 4-epimerase